MDTPYLPAAPENSSKWKTHCLHYLQVYNEGSCHDYSHRRLKPGLRPEGLQEQSGS